MTATDQHTRWVEVCAVSELRDDEGLRVETTPPVALFVAEGEVFCIDDICTHETYSLAEGWVEGCVVECTLHSAKFDLRSGQPLSPPATRPVRVHGVRVVGDQVLVNLPDSYSLPSED